MSARDQQRLIALRSALKIAKTALQAIQFSCGDRHFDVAEKAMDEITEIESRVDPTPLAPLLGHGKPNATRSRR